MKAAIDIRELNRAQASRAYLAAFAGIAIWMLAIKTGERLPYLVTPFARDFRAMFVFPALLALLGWFTFAHRWRQTGKTGYAMRMSQLASGKERVKQTALAVCGLLLLPAGIAWTSIHLAAWAAHFAARTPTASSYHVVDKVPKGASFVLEMRDASASGSVFLYVPSRTASNLQPGKVVCARGRSSLFGTLIDSLEDSGCLRSPQNSASPPASGSKVDAVLSGGQK